MRIHTGGVASDGEVLNLGRGGAFVASNDPLPKQGATVRVVLETQEAGRLVASGVVAWTKSDLESPRSELPGFGLSITEWDGDAAALFAALRLE